MVEFPYFALPVDDDHMATELRIFCAAKPHMRAFHLVWISLFTCFFSTFATAPLFPIIRDNLNLTDADIGNAGVVSVSGAILATCYPPLLHNRGPANRPCNLFNLFHLLYFWVHSLSLLGRVVHWQFRRKPILDELHVLHMRSRVSKWYCKTGGWASVGSGLTQFLVSIIYSLICRFNVDSTAWRIAFFVPATLQTVSALAVLAFGQDLPDGDYQTVQTSGTKQKRPNVLEALSHGIKNFRGWILAFTYGFCFGVELAMDNIVAQYFSDRFNVNVETAGIIAASFGLANLVSKSFANELEEIGRTNSMART